MANEERFGIRIETTAKGDGAKKTAQELEKVSEKAKEAGKDLAAVGDEGKKGGDQVTGALDQAKGALDTFSASTKTGKTVIEVFSKTLSGDLAGGVSAAKEAINGLKLAFAGSPIGLLITGLTTLVGLWALFSRDTKKAGADAEEAGGKLKGLGSDTKEAAKGVDLMKTAMDAVSTALSKAADEAERFRAARDEVLDAKAALAIARTNLAEKQGKLTPEQAAERRTTIRAQQEERKASDAMVEQGTVVMRARQQQTAAQEAERQAAGQLYDAQKGYEAVGGALPMTPEVIEKSRAAAKQKLEEAKAYQEDESGTGPYRGDLIKEAEAQVAAAEELAKAFGALTAAEDKAKQAQAALSAAMEKGNATIAQANKEIELQRIKRDTARTEIATDRQEQANQQQKETQDFRTRAEEMRQKMIGETEKMFQAGEPKPTAPAAPARGAGENEDFFKNRAEAQAIGSELGGIKARTPEDTKRLESAAEKLADGLQGNEGADIGAALERVAASLERAGKAVEASGVRQLQSRIQRLETAVQNFEGKLSRIESAQTSSGS